MNEAIISILFKLVQEAPLSVEETLQLEGWKAERPAHMELIQSVLDERSLQEKMQRLNSYDKEAGQQKLLELVYEPTATPKRNLFAGRRTYYAAAILLALAGIGTYLLMEFGWFSNVSTRQHPVDPSTTLRADAVPGGNRASLTLADGSVILLDSAADGKLADQGTMQVVKLANGQVGYEALKQSQHDGKIQEEKGEIAYNTISTPKGGQYQVVLPDGSKAWLNAASSIRFPTMFAKDRKVAVTGEVFFEIAADRNKQFLVGAAGTEVQVLGTSFNINVYEDEPVFKISLLDGSVKVLKQVQHDAGVLLKPGQAYINGNVVKTNLQQDLAWKNGWFSFSDADLPAVMRQLRRWYDVEVVYEGKVPAMKFNGDIDKNLTLTQVLKGLGKSSVKYRMEGDHKIIILPAN